MKGEYGYWRDSWRRRLSRRRLLKGAGLGSAGLAAAAFLGCAAEEKAPAPGAAPAPGTAPAAKHPKRGGTLTRAGGIAGSYDTRGLELDPHVVATIVSQGQRLYYQGLLGYDLRAFEKIEPELAQKWEIPSPTEYIFRLQPGVRWQNKPPANGRELKIEDVIFSLERARTDKPLFQHRSLLDFVVRMEAIDKATLRITTKAPHAGLLSNLSGDGLLVLAPEVVEKVVKLAPLPENAVGTGPFVAKSLEERVAAEYVRNPDYWKADRPYLDGVRTVHTADETTAFAAFQAGQVQIANVPGIEAKRYIARQGPGFTPDWFKSPTNFAVTPNTARKPMDDPRVTRALRLFLDHHELKTAWAEVQNGRGRLGSVLPPAHDAFDLTEDEYAKRIFWKQPKDEAIKEGVELLRAAGFTKDNPLKIEQLFTSLSRIVNTGAELVHAQLRQNSQGTVDPGSLKAEELTVFLPRQAQGNFTYGVYGFIIGTNDVGDFMFTLYHSRGARNRMRYKDAKVDALLERQRTIFDFEQRKAVIKEAVTFMADNVPGVIMAGDFSLQGAAPRVRGFGPEGNNINGRQYEQIWLDV